MSKEELFDFLKANLKIKVEDASTPIGTSVICSNCRCGGTGRPAGLRIRYQIDDDGYPLTTPKNTSGNGDRHEWEKWMNKKVVPDVPEGGNDYDWEPCTRQSGPSGSDSVLFPS